MRLSIAPLASVVSRAALVALVAGCGHTAIRVDGLMRDSPEMRPLQNVPGDAYRQVRVLVRSAADEGQGTAQCGYTKVEGTMESEDLKNAACVPSDAQNDAVRIVRQRLRSYGAQVARDASEPYDYAVDVRVSGLAPKESNRLAAKAMARLTFTLRKDDATNGFFGGVDMAAAAAAFAQVARDCALTDAEMSAFSASSTQPMNPAFDMMALAADAVDNAVGCVQIARFFREAHTRFAKAPPVSPAPPAPGAPPPPPPP